MTLYYKNSMRKTLIPIIFIIVAFTKANAQFLPQDSLILKNPHLFFLDLKPKKAFFCRLEDRMIQKSKLNFSFRLGSKDYTNYMEYWQKPTN